MSRPPATPFLELVGLGASPGLAVGPLIRNDDSLRPEEVRGAILAARRAVPDDLERIMASAGTLTLGGALLSHVSLLSRELGKPSVTLAPGANARWVEDDGDALIELRDVVGGGGCILQAGDVILLDGDAGRIAVPGLGTPDGGLKASVRGVHAALRRFADDPDDARALAEALELAGDPDGPCFRFLLDAALSYRLVPSGAAVERLLAAAQARTGSAEAMRSRLEPIAARALRRGGLRGRAALEHIAAAADLDDLARTVGAFERSCELERSLLRDLRRSTDPLDARSEAVRRAAQGRRATLQAVLRSEVSAALELPDDVLRHRIGMLYQLLRRARHAKLGDELVAPLHARLRRHVAAERERAGGHVTVALDEDVRYDRSLVGGKAAGLLQIRPVLPARCCVPRGFVVTTAAYRLHLLGEVGERLQVAVEEERDPDALSRRARAALLSGPVPGEVRRAIRERCATLSAPRLAVRSSSTAEDGPAGSLAGLYDTWLGVRSDEDLAARVRQAWMSLWNARALRTLLAAGIAPLGVSQAVLIQEVVETRSAGVLFSRDPGGQPDCLLVNAAWGLGEAISQGEITGDLFWVRRSSGELLRHVPGGGSRAIALDPERTGTVEVAIPEGRRGVACLQQPELERLALLARSLEDATGRGQDVEFGFSDEGELAVFQVRRVVAPPVR